MAGSDTMRRHTAWATGVALLLYAAMFLAFAVALAWLFSAAITYDSSAIEILSLPVYTLSFVVAGFVSPLVSYRVFKAADRRVVFFAFCAGVAVLAAVSAVLNPLHESGALSFLLFEYVLSVGGARLALFLAGRKAKAPAAAEPSPAG